MTYPTGICSLSELQMAIATHPQRWRPLVLTNGCFDLIHVGHVRYLTRAKALGRSLIVGINSDASVRAIKPAPPGYPSRPIVPDHHRAEVVAALKSVDAAIIFAEHTAENLVIALEPDVYVKGGDYQIETLPEAAAVQRYGGRIQFIPIEVPSSTTQIVTTILQVGERSLDSSTIRETIE